MNTRDSREEERLLELLDQVGRRSDVSQRHLARHMGVALGLANSYLRRCIRKGLIKIAEAPANRYLYYLTPKGFSEKSRLTAKYLSTSFEFYRQAGRSCADILRECEASGWERILLCGVSDLAEIMMLRALEADAAVIGIIDADTERKEFLGRKIWRTFKAVEPFDCCVLTDLTSPRTTHAWLMKEIGAVRVLVPEILRF